MERRPITKKQTEKMKTSTQMTDYPADVILDEEMFFFFSLNL